MNKIVILMKQFPETLKAVAVILRDYLRECLIIFFMSTTVLLYRENDRLNRDWRVSDREILIDKKINDKVEEKIKPISKRVEETKDIVIDYLKDSTVNEN